MEVMNDSLPCSHNDALTVCFVAGISVMYFLALVFLLFQNYHDVNEILYWLYPELRHEQPDDKVRA
jgi:hypothetical protein